MASSRTCRADSDNGEYRCLFLASAVHVNGRDTCVAEPLDAYLVSPTGHQTKLALTPVKGHGATESAALTDACGAFTSWVGAQKPI